ncbi:MAG: class I SAM-dependent methyltransferase [Alphaproteobacteria bacterium]|nr:class I SAM-dependent methyltransferase [Alphaproteobacteria bacterium]
MTGLVARLARAEARFRDNPRKAVAAYYRRLYWRLSDFPFDRLYGIATAEIIGIHDHEKQVYRYEPIPYVTLRAIARHMSDHGVRVPLFVDVGCGLGRPLYFFASRFETLLGIELSESIADLARRRLAKARDRHAAYGRIQLVTADATQAVPLDRDMVVFLYNPFGPGPMARLCQHLAHATGDLHIYYANPHHADVMAKGLQSQEERLKGFFDVAYFRVPANPSASLPVERAERRQRTSD